MVSAGWPGTAGHPRWALSGLSGTAVWRALGVRKIQTRWVSGKARPWWFFCSWVPPRGRWQCTYMLGTGARVFVGGEVIVALTSHLKAVTFCFHHCQHTHLPWNLEQSSHECGYLGIFLVYSVLGRVPMGTCTSVYPMCACLCV